MTPPWEHSRPFRTCVECGRKAVFLDRRENESLMWRRCRVCSTMFFVPSPLSYHPGRFNGADGVARGLFRAGMPLTSISLVMRLYHNVELTAKTWGQRMERYS